MLYNLVQKKNWDGVVRLCRFVQSMHLWACTACMAIESKFLSLSFNYVLYLNPLRLLGRELEVVENALAAIKV